MAYKKSEVAYPQKSYSHVRFNTYSDGLFPMQSFHFYLKPQVHQIWD